MEPILFGSFALSFLVVLLVTPQWIKRARKAGLVGSDMHKPDKREIPEIGGIVVVLGFLVGVLFYVSIRTFYFGDTLHIVEILAILCSILIITIIGLIDDILGWKIGLRQWEKPLLTLIAALPVMVVSFNHTVITIPLFGSVDLGVIYALIIVPIAIVGASNGFNMLAGYNGLESLLGICVLLPMAYISWTSGFGWMSVIILCMIFSLASFLYYNKYPSRIFPGDSLTYSVGAFIACAAIFGNMQKIALILFIPYFIELALKARGRFKKESFAHIDHSGSLSMPYRKMYGLEHVAIYVLNRFKHKVTEPEVVALLCAFQLFFSLIVVIL